jgi:hypothetical protein
MAVCNCRRPIEQLLLHKKGDFQERGLTHRARRVVIAAALAPRAKTNLSIDATWLEDLRSDDT